MVSRVSRSRVTAAVRSVTSTQRPPGRLFRRARGELRCPQTNTLASTCGRPDGSPACSSRAGEAHAEHSVSQPRIRRIRASARPRTHGSAFGGSVARCTTGNRQYEPKWDGFRCLAFKSRATRSGCAPSRASRLGRYFPEMVAFLRGPHADQFVVDGELVIEIDRRLSFDALQMRLHPAESRILKLSVETPARLILFDMLAAPGGGNLLDRPLTTRRDAFGALGAIRAASGERLALSPCTRDLRRARKWLDDSGQGSTDGEVAETTWTTLYRPGKRAMIKVKRLRTADCVVGGFRYESRGKHVGSLLLGLYNDAGLLDHVGFTATIPEIDQRGANPGGLRHYVAARDLPARHPAGRAVEHRTQRRMGEAAAGTCGGGPLRSRDGRPFSSTAPKLLRWRPDKAPRQCTDRTASRARRRGVNEPARSQRAAPEGPAGASPSLV